MSGAGVPPDFYLKAVAALGALLFGGSVLAGGPRRRANLLLAGFLLLIAGNQAVEALRALAPPASHDLASFRLATVFAIADPLLLYGFAAAYPKPNRLGQPLRWIPLAAAGAGLLAWALWVPVHDPKDPRFMWGELALATYTAVAYLAVWTWALRLAMAGAGPPGARLLFAAMCCAAIPGAERVGAGLASLAAAASGSGADPFLRMALWLPLFAGTLAAAAWRTRRDPPAARSALRWTIVGAALTVLLNLSVLLDGAGLGGLDLGPLGRGAAAVRWLLFGGLVSVAVLRHEMLGMGMGLRRAAARLLVAFAFLALAAVLLDSFGFVFGADRPSLGFELAVLGIALVLSQGFRAGVHRAAAALYGVPDRSDPAAAADAYRLAVLQAFEGGLSPQDPPMRRLQAELGLDDRTAAAIAKTAGEAVGGPLAAGQVLGGRFRVLRFLGRGGSGRAFLAKDDLLDRTVVLKEVLTDRPEDEAAVLREARLAAGLQHPNVVTVHDVLRRPGSILVVSEHVAGGSLLQRLLDGSLDTEAALRVADGVLAGLEAIHERGIVHRDVTPGNVLLQPDGTPKIADFGIAHARRGATARFDRLDVVHGTPDFLAPEQRRGEPATPASDAYQAAVLVGRLFGGALPKGLAAPVRRALRAAPAERPTVRELREAVQRAAATARAVTPGRRARSGPRR